MFSYRFPVAIVTTMALLQSPVIVAQDIAEVNNIARNISVKITGYGNGSGFIFERENNTYSVVTNKHVVPIDNEYEIQTYDGIKHQVTNKQEIPNLDLAIIQFESTEKYEVAELGNSDGLEPRQFVSVAGFPGIETNLEIIDGQIRRIKQEIIETPQKEEGYALIYTNPTLPGSSGGAVLDEEGRVVAINGEGETDIKTGREISRGIPINLFLEAKENLVATEDNSSESRSLHPSTSQDYSNLDFRDFIFSNNNTAQKYKLAYTIPNGDQNDVNISSTVVNDNYYVGSGDNTIKVWNLATGELEHTLTGHSGSIASISVNNNKIVSGGSWGDNTIKIWDLVTGELEYNLTGHSPVTSVAISRNRIVSCGDRTIKIWNLDTGELEYNLTDHLESVLVCKVAASGDKIISGDSNNTVKIWNLVTGELEHTLVNHYHSIWSMAVSKKKGRSSK